MSCFEPCPFPSSGPISVKEVGSQRWGWFSWFGSFVLWLIVGGLDV